MTLEFHIRYWKPTEGKRIQGEVTAPKFSVLQKFPPEIIKEASESFQTLSGMSWIVTKSEVTT